MRVRWCLPFRVALPPAPGGCCGWVVLVPWPGENLSPQCHPSRQLHMGALARLPSERTVPRTSLLQDVLAYGPETLITAIRPPNQSRCTGAWGLAVPPYGGPVTSVPRDSERAGRHKSHSQAPPRGGGRGFTRAAFPLRSGHSCSHSQPGQLCPSRGPCLGAVLVVTLGA